MKLIIAIVHNSDKRRVTDALVAAGHSFTKLGSAGGFLRQGSTTLLVGVEDAEVAGAMQLFKENCQTAERVVSVAASPDAAVGRAAFSPDAMTEEVGGGVAFVLGVESFEKL